MSNAFAKSLSLRDALMRGFRIYDHTEKVGEAHKGGVSEEGLLRHGWPALADGLRQACL